MAGQVDGNDAERVRKAGGPWLPGEKRRIGSMNEHYRRRAFRAAVAIVNARAVGKSHELRRWCGIFRNQSGARNVGREQNPTQRCKRGNDDQKYEQLSHLSGFQARVVRSAVQDGEHGVKRRALRNADRTEFEVLNFFGGGLAYAARNDALAFRGHATSPQGSGEDSSTLRR